MEDHDGVARNRIQIQRMDFDPYRSCVRHTESCFFAVICKGLTEAAMLYRNLAEILGERIEQGLYRPGDRPPSVRVLSQEHGVA